MKSKIDRNKKTLSCFLAAIIAVSASGLSASAFSTTFQAYPGHGGSSITSQASTKAASGDYGWQNEINLLKSVGNLKPDGTGYSSLLVPGSTNKSAVGVNKNGENASDREANTWDNDFTFYMDPPAETDDYEYEVTRGGKTYTFNKSNNWGWGNADTGAGAIKSIPAKGDTTGSTTYNTTDLVYSSKTNDNLDKLGLNIYSPSHTSLTYNDLFDWTSKLVARNRNISDNSITWRDSNNIPTNLLSVSISNALGLKYVTAGYYTSVNKPTSGAAGDADWQRANNYLAWIYSKIGPEPEGSGEIDTYGLSLKDIVDNSKYYNKDVYSMAKNKDIRSLGDIALEALKCTKHSGWGFALQESDKGNLSCIYKNVGQWYDKENDKWHNVNVKLTVMDYQGNDMFNFRAARYSASGKATSNNKSDWIYTNLAMADFYDDTHTATYGGATLRGNEYTAEHPKMSFNASKVGIDTMWDGYIKCNYSFFDSETGEALDVSGRSVWKDIDGGQSVSFGKGVTGIYDYDKKTNLSTSIKNYTGTSDLKAGSYDPLLYKRWTYTNPNGTSETYTGAFDWLSVSTEDHYTTNWVYAEFKGSFDVIYGLAGHQNINNAGVKYEYDSEEQTLNISAQSGVTPSADYKTSSFNYTTSTGTLGSVSVNTIDTIATGYGHLVNNSPETEYRGNLVISKLIKRSNGQTVAATKSDMLNTYFVIMNSAGKYVTYDSSSSSEGNYTASVNTVSQYQGNGGLARFKVGDDGTIRISGLQQGAYFIFEIIGGDAVDRFIETSITSPDGKIVYDNNTPATVKATETTNVRVVNSESSYGNLLFSKKEKISENSQSDSVVPDSVISELEFLVYRLDYHLTNSGGDNIYLISHNASSTTGEYIFSASAPAPKYSTGPLNASRSAFVYKLDSKGQFKISNLPAGTYLIREITNHDRYNGTMKDVTITVKKDSTAAATGYNILKTGSIEITKTNEDGTTPADGIQFMIAGTTYLGTSYVNTFTLKDGKVVVNDIPLGTLNIIELPNAVPDGYASALTQIVTLSENGQKLKVNVTNPSVPGPIKITKNLTKAYYTQEEFVYSVTERDLKGNTSTFMSYIVIPAGETTGSVIIDNCKSGCTYTVKELNTNWRYTPVTDKTYLTINGNTFDKISSQTQQYVKYGKSNSDNSMTFKLLNPKVNDFNCIFTNDGHDYWLDDGDTVTNVMKPIE